VDVEGSIDRSAHPRDCRNDEEHDASIKQEQDNATHPNLPSLFVHSIRAFTRQLHKKAEKGR